ncbi:hypothetical protein D9611_006259 [Ephemerocybe angulata]|uniref:Uncharacterized protein n=1 Tax=Ephemerocybe angulata TaxID=980116 RepID=A0A8H5C6J1_9AGAR|nr:hypothetical protein D9611_006259 [Tulosesus angulatus]
MDTGRIFAPAVYSRLQKNGRPQRFTPLNTLVIEERFGCKASHPDVLYHSGFLWKFDANGAVPDLGTIDAHHKRQRTCTKAVTGVAGPLRFRTLTVTAWRSRIGYETSDDGSSQTLIAS